MLVNYIYKKNNMYSGTLINASLILPLPTSPVDVIFNRMSLESCCDIISIYLEALRILISEPNLSYTRLHVIKATMVSLCASGSSLFETLETISLYYHLLPNK